VSVSHGAGSNVCVINVVSTYEKMSPLATDKRLIKGFFTDVSWVSVFSSPIVLCVHFCIVIKQRGIVFAYKVNLLPPRVQKFLMNVIVIEAYTGICLVNLHIPLLLLVDNDLLYRSITPESTSN
jgi:hypothetical protein